jgi:hypothetical protein
MVQSPSTVLQPGSKDPCEVGLPVRNSRPPPSSSLVSLAFHTALQTLGKLMFTLQGRSQRGPRQHQCVCS